MTHSPNDKQMETKLNGQTHRQGKRNTDTPANEEAHTRMYRYVNIRPVGRQVPEHKYQSNHKAWLGMTSQLTQQLSVFHLACQVSRARFSSESKEASLNCCFPLLCFCVHLPLAWVDASSTLNSQALTPFLPALSRFPQSQGC